MPPKKKDAQPVPLDDFSQDVVLLASVDSTRLSLSLLAAQTDRLAPEVITDPGAVPQLHVELVHGSQASAACAITSLSADFTAALGLEHKFRHRKGPDIIDRLINSSFEIRVCNQSRAVLATAAVDLLPFGLGDTAIVDAALPLQPADVDEPVRVLPGSSVSVSIKLMHQPMPVSMAGAAGAATPTSTSQSGGTVVPGSGAAPASSAAAAAAAAAAASATAGPLLEPLDLLGAEEAAGCNVIEFAPLAVRPLPAQLPAVIAGLNGSMAFSLGLHLPGPVPVAVVCTGGTFGQDQVAWSKSSRAHLTSAAVQGLKASLELGRPLLLEVARQAVPASTTEALSDPAFSSYHALLQLECAAEQLQEPGAMAAAGLATALGCMSWAVQQGRVAAPCLPPYSPPAGRSKVVEEAPPAPADASQPPLCAWLAAGSRFTVQLRLARALYAPWQPPSRPGRQLADLIPERLPPPPPPALTAVDRFRRKVQAVAEQLAADYAAACSSAEGGAVPGVGQQQALVFQLNSSGRYLALKDELKQLVLGVVRERYRGAQPSPAQAQQLHSDLYVHLTDELRKAMASAQQAAVARQQQQPAAAGAVAAISSSSSSDRVDPADRLLQLAAECEACGDEQRGHVLHQQRLVLLQSADAWHDYGTFCMRTKRHVRAEAAFREALSRDQQHIPAAACLICLGLAQAADADAGDAAADGGVLEWTEVLGHSLRDAAAAAAVDDGAVPLAWALLALLYRLQGKAKESSARSCHQEVVRQSKAALAAAGAGAGSTCGAGGAAADSAEGGAVSYAASAAANAYLAAAELAVQLMLPGLAAQLLELAAGLRDPSGQLTRRMRLAAIAVAQQSGDIDKATQLVQELSEQAAAGGGERDKALAQVLLGDLQYESQHHSLAKQHYRRALQKAPAACPAQLYRRLGHCFMASGDAAAAADVFTAALEAPGGAVGGLFDQPLAGLAAAAGVGQAGGRCASVWLGLGMAHMRAGDIKSAELALAEANMCDPEHPVVWAHLALLSLMKGREQDADVSLGQAQRHGLRQQELLVELADSYQEIQRFGTAAGLLVQAIAAQDTMRVRCKLAAVMLAQRDYSGCHEQLTAAAALSGDSQDDQLLASIVDKLQVAWPHL